MRIPHKSTIIWLLEMTADYIMIIWLVEMTVEMTAGSLRLFTSCVEACSSRYPILSSAINVKCPFIPACNPKRQWLSTTYHSGRLSNAHNSKIYDKQTEIETIMNNLLLLWSNI